MTAKRYTLAIFYFLCLFSNASLAQSIRGNIQNPALEEVNILVDDILTSIDTSLVLDKGSFKTQLGLKNARSGIIIAEGEEIDFFAAPNEDIFLTFDTKKGAVFSGKSSGNNNFLQAFRKQFDKADVEIGISGKVKRKVPQANLEKYLDSLQTIQLAYIEKKKAFYTLSDDFLHYLKTEITYQLAPYRSKTPEGLFADERMLVSSAYRSYLETQVKPKNVTQASYSQLYEGIKQRFKGKAKFYAMMLMVQQAIDNDTDENVRKLFTDFKTNNTAFADLTTFLQSKYQARESLFAGSDAPNFTLSDFSGKRVSLRDFRGKVVYLDFWATNCAPCLKNFQHSNNLREQFSESDVVFLYIALDEDRDNAKKILEKLQVGGVQVFDTKGFESDVAMAYNVKSLPNYIIIDRNGKIFNSQNIAPWQTKILDLLQKAGK